MRYITVHDGSLEIPSELAPSIIIPSATNDHSCVFLTPMSCDYQRQSNDAVVEPSAANFQVLGLNPRVVWLQ